MMSDDWRVIAYTEDDMSIFNLFEGPEAEARAIATQAPGAADHCPPDGKGGQTRTGTKGQELASNNGRSLMLEFEAVLHGHVGTMLVER